MPDWTKSMQQTYEYYRVDPETWTDIEPVQTVKSSSIVRDLTNDTLGSASFNITTDPDECYIRTYLVTIQNGVRERTVLGTHLCQTPSVSYDGKATDISIDAYTPLVELKEKKVPVGYALAKNVNILATASSLTRENMRPPVVTGSNTAVLPSAFVSSLTDSWFDFLSDLLACARYRFGLDELSRVIFEPEQDLNSLRPVWVYNDDNSSIIQPSIKIDRDLYGIPNVLEVVYSPDGREPIVARVVNNDPNSPISTVNRGREIMTRITDPDIYGSSPTYEYLLDYATQALRDASSLEYTLTYTHGYCPVRIGDCVLLNYTRAGLRNVKAKVTRQSIKCEPGCPVEETAVYTTNLWGR